MNKYRSSDKTSYILGISLIVEALLNVPKSIKLVYLSSKANKNKELDKLLSLCKKYDIEVIEDDKVIDSLSLKENCYGIGVFEKYKTPLTTDKHIVLYNFSDEGDLGTIFRSATSFDFKDIVLINSSVDIFNPKVIRSSMGSFFHLNIKEYNSFDDYFNDHKYNLYPFVSSGKTELSDCIFKTPYSIIIPQKYDDLDKYFKEGYYIDFKNLDEICLSSLSSIVLNFAYHQNVSDKNISYKAQV